MATEPAWYPDPTNPHITRLWTGDGWGEERFWNGAAWVSRPAGSAMSAAPDASFAAPTTPQSSSPPPPVPSVRSAPPPPSGPSVMPVAYSPTAVPWASPARSLLVVGAIVAAVGTFLPWEEQTAFGVKIVSGPQGGGGFVLLLAVLGAAVWAGWTLRHRVTLTIMALGAALFVAGAFVTISSDSQPNAAPFADSGFGGLPETDVTGLIGGLADTSAKAGVGLWIYSAGVAVVWLAVVRTWLAGRNQPMTQP